MTNSPEATVSLDNDDNDDLELDEETSLPNRRIIKDPVHGFRLYPLPAAARNADDHDANSRIRFFCLQIHRYVCIFLLLPTVVRVAHLVPCTKAAVPASPAPQTARNVLFRMARRITQ